MFWSPKEASLRLLVRLHGLLGQERAQTLAEYGLIITLVAVGATVLGLMFFRNQLIFGYNSMSSCLNGSCGP